MPIQTTYELTPPVGVAAGSYVHEHNYSAESFYAQEDMRCVGQPVVVVDVDGEPKGINIMKTGDTFWNGLSINPRCHHKGCDGKYIEALDSVATADTGEFWVQLDAAATPEFGKAALFALPVDPVTDDVLFHSAGDTVPATHGQATACGTFIGIAQDGENGKVAKLRLAVTDAESIASDAS